MDKKAFELSINFLVVIIISLFIFSMGIVFVNKIFSTAEKKISEMDLQTKEELERLLDQGDKVAMPFFQKSVIHGKTATFGIGILNTVTSSPAKDFKIKIEFSVAYDKGDGEISPVSEPDTWVTYNQNAHTIKANEQGKYTIVISTPKDTEAGVYIFDAAVCYDVAPTGNDPYQTATNLCGGPFDPAYGYGYYHLQKIWLSVR